MREKGARTNSYSTDEDRQGDRKEGEKPKKGKKKE
jgi:hypothetical protein